jgi:hypothetical protein
LLALVQQYFAEIGECNSGGSLCIEMESDIERIASGEKKVAPSVHGVCRSRNTDVPHPGHQQFKQLLTSFEAHHAFAQVGIDEIVKWLIGGLNTNPYNTIDSRMNSQQIPKLGHQSRINKGDEGSKGGDKRRRALTWNDISLGMLSKKEQPYLVEDFLHEVVKVRCINGLGNFDELRGQLFERRGYNLVENTLRL